MSIAIFAAGVMIAVAISPEFGVELAASIDAHPMWSGALLFYLLLNGGGTSVKNIIKRNRSDRDNNNKRSDN